MIPCSFPNYDDTSPIRPYIFLTYQIIPIHFGSKRMSLTYAHAEKKFYC